MVPPPFSQKYTVELRSFAEVVGVPRPGPETALDESFSVHSHLFAGRSAAVLLRLERKHLRVCDGLFSEARASHNFTGSLFGASQFLECKRNAKTPNTTMHYQGTGSSCPGLTQAKEQVQTHCHHVQPGQGRVRLERCNCWDSKGQDRAPDLATCHSSNLATLCCGILGIYSQPFKLSLRAHVQSRCCWKRQIKRRLKTSHCQPGYHRRTTAQR